MNWERTLPLPWKQISFQKSVDIYNLIHRMKLLEHVLNANTHQYKNHYQENEHIGKLIWATWKEKDPNRRKSTHLLSFVW